jgi:putative tryptophan/tyrosine transport system substrate-binding protein
MKKTITWVMLAASILAGFPPAVAQQSGKVYRIGYINNAAGIRPVEDAFRKRLQELGYSEGKNLIIEWAFTKGDRDRLPGIVAELVNAKPDCIVSGGVGSTRAATQATGTIPIVMANADEDPVEQGLVASLARPGGNVTGFTNIGSELAGKRLELLKEVVPKAVRVAILSAGGGQMPGIILRKASALLQHWAFGCNRWRCLTRMPPRSNRRLRAR